MPSPSLQYLIETDVLASYLVSPPSEVSLLRLALREASCYTTMLNALELFRAARSERERAAVLSLFHVVRVLGFNARYAQQFAMYADRLETHGNHVSDREAMILGMAEASKLTILTVLYYERYQKFHAVRVVNSLTASEHPSTRPIAPVRMTVAA